MRVLSLINLPSAIPIGIFSGQHGAQAVLEDLNNSWKNAGSGVIFGDDSFSKRFDAFSSMLGQQIDAIQDTVLRSIEAVCCPNKFHEINCQEDLEHVAPCMYIPILTMPKVRPLFESGRISGWGVTASQLPEEDVYGRLINNGRFDTGDPNYDREAPVSWTYETGDPNVTTEELKMIETSREFISTFLEQQMGEGGDELDITDIPNRMGKLRELRDVPPKN